MDADPFRLQRFVDAQESVWDDVREELRTGHKTTHWMWFVFPQLAALGRSGTAKFYGITGIEEARAWLRHPVLGPRLVESCELLLGVEGRSAREIFGDVDAMKLRSCLTLFEAAAPEQPVFASVLGKYFGGERDALTKTEIALGDK